MSNSAEYGKGKTDERVWLYLRSPEVESIVRQVFATTVVSHKEAAATTLNSIRKEFSSSMSKHLDVSESLLEPLAASFFDALVSGVQATLQAAIRKNILSAHEAQSVARHRMLLDEVANVQKNIAFLASKLVIDVDGILGFEKRYRELVGSVHGYIKPPHLESGRRVPIDEIFVAPLLSHVPREKSKEIETLELPAFLSQLYRAVLLGNPGGGKSTTSAKICHDLSTRYSERLFARREITPALVILREYGSQKKSNNCSIVQFLEQQASSRYQLTAPPGAFEYLLLNGRLLVVFDGLDELLDSSYRQEITSNVETFCTIYPSAPVLVTSREVGYEQAPLNEELFESFRLAPFGERQVQEYAGKWFSRDEEYSSEQKKQKARAFFLDSAFVPDLRSNPLMLGLMCNLYRAEGYIPRNRPEVYGKCSVMLFERWDKSRDILIPLPFEEHIRPAMQDLAFWIYENGELQSGVTEHSLIQRTTNYLSLWVFDDPHKARFAACDFIRFCTGRAWVFTDTGTTREGEKLFQFTHRTFLEYFTACYLVSVHPTPQQLMDALRERIAKREWDVVTQLAFQIQSKQVHGAADDLLNLLLADISASTPDMRNVLSFAERSLEFLVPSPKVRREVARAALTRWLQDAKQLSLAQRPVPPGEQAPDVTAHIRNLLLVTAENRDTISDEIQSFLTDSVMAPDMETAQLSAQMILTLSHPLHRYDGGQQITVDPLKYWEGVSEAMLKEKRSRILEIARHDQCVAIRCYWRSIIRLPDAVSWFGIPFLVSSIRSPAQGNVWNYPVGLLLLDVFLMENDQEIPQTERDSWFEDLEGLAGVFLQTPLPWIRQEDREPGPGGLWFSRYGHQREDRKTQLLTFSPDASFSILCILGIETDREFALRKKAESTTIGRYPRGFQGDHPRPPR